MRETQKDKKNKVITDYLIIMMQPLKEIIFFVTIQEAGKQVQTTDCMKEKYELKTSF